MKKLRVISASAAVLILFGAPVVAQSGAGDRRSEAFDRLDSDKDGAVSVEEFIAGNRRFARFDLNADGTVSEDEIDAAIAERMRRFKDRMLARLDGDGDRSVSRAEYDEQRRERFSRLDANGDGRIERTEASAVRPTPPADPE
ncbi:MAG: EF-hand domain-containing protein [Pseudomonadota bacterium]